MYQGDTDIVTSTNTVYGAVKNSGNENLSIKIIENSGHMPCIKIIENSGNMPSAAGMEEVLSGILKYVQC